MPVELSELLNDERWVEVQVGNAILHVAYRPGANTLRHQAELQKQLRLLSEQEGADEIEQAEQMGQVFCDLVCNWDLTDKGKALPLTPDVVTKRLPGQIFNAIMAAIGEDGRAQQEEKKALSVTSDAILVPRGKRAIVQNGTRSSEPQDTWASRRGS